LKDNLDQDELGFRVQDALDSDSLATSFTALKKTDVWVF
jgi:hypothetical protein